MSDNLHIGVPTKTRKYASRTPRVKKCPLGVTEKGIVNIKRAERKKKTKTTKKKIVENLLDFSTVISTVEPRFNEPLYNEVLDITNDFLQPDQNYSKMYETKPRYNEMMCNYGGPGTFLITISLRFHYDLK